MTPDMKNEYAKTLVFALQNCPPEWAVPIADEYLLNNASDGPVVTFDDINADAALWVTCATPSELRVYLFNILKRLRGEPFGAAQRKKMFVQFWETFADADRAAFLSKVDPNGQFVQGIAA